MDYNKKGAHVFESMFSLQELKKVKQDIIKTFEMFTDQTFINDSSLIDFFVRDPDSYVSWIGGAEHLLSLYELGTNSKIIKVLQECGLKRPALNSKPRFLMSNKHISCSKFPWKFKAHQDWFLMRGSKNSAVLWLPLDELTSELGPLEIAYGSHKDGLLTSLTDEHLYMGSFDEDRFEFEPVSMNVGDALIFDGYTVHRSGINQTEDKIRWVVTFRYDDLSEPSFIQRQYPKSSVPCIR